MPLGVAFWVIMLVWAVFGLLTHFGVVGVGAYGAGVNAILLFVLFAILGWQAFGPMFRRG
jgi:low affinity Fe/Cu permease